jgi:adenine-specific DNA-methyltransferase
MIYSDNIPLLKFLTAILNSKAAGYFYATYYCGGSLGHNGLRYKKEFLQKLPVPDLNQKIIEQHERILGLKSKGIDTAHQERLIDNLVFKLYQLDYSEVKTIEPDFALSESEYNAIAI